MKKILILASSLVLSVGACFVDEQLAPLGHAAGAGGAMPAMASSAGSGGAPMSASSSTRAGGGDAGVADASPDGDGDGEACWPCGKMLEAGAGVTLADAAKLCASSAPKWTDLYGAACNAVCAGPCTAGRDNFCNALVHDPACIACLADSPPNGEGALTYACKSDTGAP